MTDCEDDDCGAEFHPERADARFCSSACRQRAYRRRKAILQRYGSWENALAELTKNAPWSVTDKPDASRNATGAP